MLEFRYCNFWIFPQHCLKFTIFGAPNRAGTHGDDDDDDDNDDDDDDDDDDMTITTTVQGKNR